MEIKKSKLKRRLRKKLRVGEFQELGFEISVKFKSNLDETAFDKFLDEFIDEVENNQLYFGGGGNTDDWSGFITSQKKYQSPSIAQKEQIKNWLVSRSEIAKCEVGNFVDAWYNIKLEE